MRTNVWTAFAGAGIAALLVAVPVARASTASEDTQQPKTVTGTIEKIDHDTNTVTLDTYDKQLKLGRETRVTKGGAKISASELREGDEIRASYAAPSSDTYDVTNIQVLPAGKGTGASGTSSGGMSQ
jgi:Cu/Ag efflux protein CusF